MYADNAMLLDVLRENSDVRGIAVVGPHTPETEWRELEACPGVRGARITTQDPNSPELELIEPLAERLAATGRHLQLHVSAQMLVALAPRLAKLPGTLVIDHFGRLAPSDGPDSVEFRTLARLLSAGRVYCKLAMTQRISFQPAPYDDIAWLGKALVDVAPEQMLWGTNWPNYVQAHAATPDAGVLLDCLATWAPDEEIRDKILVDNPAGLYSF